MQNHAARLTFRKKRHDHATPLFNKKLHWLPVLECIVFKLATFSFHYFVGTLPPYFPCCLSSYSSSRSLCSSSQECLFVPKVSLKSTGARSFQYQAPLVWNSLPVKICLCSSLSFIFILNQKHISSSTPFNKISFLPVCVYRITLTVWLYVCRESVRIMFYFFFRVSGWECLSLDFVSLFSLFVC